MMVANTYTNHRKDVGVDYVSQKLLKREFCTACTPCRVEARLLDLQQNLKSLLISTHERCTIELEEFISTRGIHRAIFFFVSLARIEGKIIIIKTNF
jgi:hypothetical protein